jgi:hypothetical protein
VSNKEQAVTHATNQFYSIIPHDFGFRPPQIIDSIELLNNKIKMMETLMDIEIAAQILKSDSATSPKSEVDQKYEALNVSRVKGGREGKLVFESCGRFIHSLKLIFKFQIDCLFDS